MTDNTHTLLLYIYEEAIRKWLVLVVPPMMNRIRGPIGISFTLDTNYLINILWYVFNVCMYDMYIK